MTSLSPVNTPPKTVFLDANVLLEIILSRTKEQAVRQFLHGQLGDFYVSALTAHSVVHFGKALVGLPVLRTFLSDYTICSLERPDFEWAFMNIRNQDFEDALQLAVAIRNGCNQFVTLDKDLAAAYQGLPSIETLLIS